MQRMVQGINNADEIKWVRTIAFVAVGDATGALSTSRERDALIGELDAIEPELLQHTQESGVRRRELLGRVLCVCACARAHVS